MTHERTLDCPPTCCAQLGGGDRGAAGRGCDVPDTRRTAPPHLGRFRTHFLTRLGSTQLAAYWGATYGSECFGVLAPPPALLASLLPHAPLRTATPPSPPPQLPTSPPVINRTASSMYMSRVSSLQTASMQTGAGSNLQAGGQQTCIGQQQRIRKHAASKAVDDTTCMQTWQTDH